MKFCLKITLCMLGLLSVLFGVGGSLMITHSFHASLAREQESAYTSYRMILGTLQIVGSVNGQLNEKDLTRTLEQLSNQNAASWRALRLYTAERQLYANNASSLVSPTERPLPGSCAIQYMPTADNEQQLVLSGALKTGDETLYLEMARDISALFVARQTQQQTYQWVFLLLMGLCALFSYSTAHILTRPLAGLSKASRAISTGQLSCRAQIASNDEIGFVARDFNAMAESLETHISALKQSVERQERFVASFAHEVKTPMTSIIGYADLIRGETLSVEEQRQAAHYIVSESKRLESLSQKLLEILVLKQGKIFFSPVQASDLIQGLANHLEPLYARQGIALRCDCAKGICLLEPDLIKSLLVNLLENARKAMEQQPGKITIGLAMLHDGCRISIQDSGQGIPDAALEHLTEAFYRVDKSRSRMQGGVGLGLSLCREIAALHHGNIRFESQMGIGTTVIVTLKGGAS